MAAMYIQAWKKCSQRMSASQNAETARTTMKIVAPTTISHSGIRIEQYYVWRHSRFTAALAAAAAPFVAARYYRFRMPIFRDEIRASGSVVSIGISLWLRLVRELPAPAGKKAGHPPAWRPR